MQGKREAPLVNERARDRGVVAESGDGLRRACLARWTPAEVAVRATELLRQTEARLVERAYEVRVQAVQDGVALRWPGSAGLLYN